MSTSFLTTLQRFFAYQRERFPLIVLVVSLLPAILSSGVIVASRPSLGSAGLILIASLAYLLHIRIIDEHRDFRHDSLHHTHRPVQSGLISRRELELIDIVAVVILVGVALLFGRLAIGIVGLMLAYSYLAGKEFFLGEKLRQHFFLYNAVNIGQMFLMQIFVYLAFTQTLPLTTLLLTHFIFTTVGTITFEFLRKLKIPSQDGTGKDTYTWYIGFGNSLLLFVGLVLLGMYIWSRLVMYLSLEPFFWFWVAAGGSSLIAGVALVHFIKRQRLTDHLLQLSFLLLYALANLVIYFIKNPYGSI